MERALLATIPVTDDDLSELAERRAYAARNALGTLGVAPERMFVVAAKPGADAKPAPRVDFVLK
jgi:hypothetical protein